MARFGRAALALALLSAALVAQEPTTPHTSFVGPSQAPLGADIVIGITNLTEEDSGVGLCPFDILGPDGPVEQPPCALLGLVLEPMQSHTVHWDQRDAAGNQVPAGHYTINVHLPGGDYEVHEIELGDFAAGLALTELAVLGQTAGMRLEAPGDGGLPYVVMASEGSAPGIPTCGGLLPLNPDLLWVQSLSAPGVFLNWGGLLDPSGVSSAPQLVVPSNPIFQGWSFHAAMVTLDPGQPCWVRSISAPEWIPIH